MVAGLSHFQHAVVMVSIAKQKGHPIRVSLSSNGLGAVRYSTTMCPHSVHTHLSGDSGNGLLPLTRVVSIDPHSCDVYLVTRHVLPVITNARVVLHAVACGAQPVTRGPMVLTLCYLVYSYAHGVLRLCLVAVGVSLLQVLKHVLALFSGSVRFIVSEDTIEQVYYAAIPLGCINVMGVLSFTPIEQHKCCD